MQIYEITQRRHVDEGLMDTLKGAGQKVAGAFNNPASMGLGSNAAFATAQANSRLQAATKDFAKRTAAEWVKQSAELANKPNTTGDTLGQTTIQQRAANKPATTAQPSAQKPGVRLPKVPATPGQMSAGVAGSKTGQNMQKMFGKPKGGIAGMTSDLEEAFNDLPGSVQAGGTVAPNVNAVPKSIAIPTAQRNSSYAQSFQNWVNQKLTTRETTTGQTINMTEVVKRIPAIEQQLKTALTSVYASRNDPIKLQTATENYLTIAATGFQQAAQQIRKENPDAVAKAATSTAKKRIATDPQTEKVVQAMGMADSGLDTLADIVKQKGERVTNKTGSNTIDRLLTAAGLI